MRTSPLLVLLPAVLAMHSADAATCPDYRDGYKNVYFGDMHTHTSYSLDAYFFNALTTPLMSHQFAKGAAALPLPAKGSQDVFTRGYEIRIDRPLDFNAVTDHAEFIGGMYYSCNNTPQTQQACDQAVGQGVRRDIRAIAAGNTPFHTQQLQAAVTVSPTGELAWQETMQMNDDANEPCTYTTLHGYEYTSNELSQMFHRNVIFNGPRESIPAKVFGAVKPYSALLPENANDEWELFDHLQGACREETGCRVLTIPHNPNMSDGRMFLAADEDNGMQLTEPLAGRPLGRKIELTNVFNPMTAADAELRTKYDRAVEMTQHKGQSECAIGLEGNYALTDEDFDPDCNFEINKSVCTGAPDQPASCAAICTGDPTRDPAFCENRDEGGNKSKMCASTGPDGLSDGNDGDTGNCTHPLDYYRNAMVEGMKIRQALGTNPYKLNITASLDTHNGDSGNAAERNFHGHGGVLDDDPAEQLGFWDCNGPAQDPVSQRLNPATYDPASTDETQCPGRTFYDFARHLNPGGLTGAWAAENTRDEIFAAVHRGETFGTSGPRMRVRTVASWDPLPENVCEELASGRDLIDGNVVGNGARMGDNLPAPAPGATQGPHIAVWAAQDPDGHPLQEIDIIKGFLNAEGQPKWRVFDRVAATRAKVQRPRRKDCAVKTAQHPGTLCAVWQDPDFSADRDAFWYARVLEVPSCRHTTWQCVDKQVDCSVLSRQNGMFRESTGFKGYEGCCAIEGSPGNFSGAPRFHTIEERAWASPIWYEP